MLIIFHVIILFDFIDMVRGRIRAEASSSSSQREPPSSREPSSSRQRPTASTRRRRRVEVDTQPPISESIEIDESPLIVDEQHPTHQPSQEQDDDISEPLPGGPQDRSILKSFKHHVACAIWAGEVCFIKFF